jgi:hypothetical protein
MSTLFIPPVQLISSSTESEEDKEYCPQSILKKPLVHPGGIPKLSPVPESKIQISLIHQFVFNLVRIYL